ncbi:MAG TPA: cell division protein FtsL [Acidimicrobiales bacterium]|nr:cell division protein FtsL [Acidimicrobiales bacterium]
MRPQRDIPAKAAPQTGVPLRVVTDDELREARRRIRVRRLAAAVASLVAVALFGVVVAHVMLMQGQFELQRLQQESARSQADYDRLRLQVSELESPTRIVAVAQQKLGMVSPPNITYLAPSSDPAALPATGSDPDAGASAAAGAPGQWSSVKSHLAGG